MSNLLEGKPYVDSLKTDIRLTWAKHCPMWAERMKGNFTPLPIASVITHYKPRATA